MKRPVNVLLILCITFMAETLHGQADALQKGDSSARVARVENLNVFHQWLRKTAIIL